MKIYTRAGDEGQTGLLGGDRVPKGSLRIQAIGDVDELNCALGVCRAGDASQGDASLVQELETVQSRLFDLGSELACPPGGKFHIEAIHDADVSLLEQSIDAMTELIEPLKNFILPGGTLAAANFHLGRAICRRAERSLLQLHAYEPLRAESLRYINRLSDWLFTAARYANHLAGVKDQPWSSRQA